jgi:acetyl-CoA carboxylase biotin carboxyl carrier protein
MELSYIKKIIKLVENSEIDEIEIEEEGKKIRVAKTRNSSATMYQVPFAPPAGFMQPLPPAQPALIPESSSGPKQPAEPQYHEIRSPIVGTFYRAPAPDAESYVEIGQSVQKGSALCIVEAMKLMNEIESDVDGKVVKILVENGKPVEYNQILFLIDTSAA